MCLLFFGYLLVFGFVLVVAIAAMIMRVSRSQNRVRSVCVAWIVISSSIFWSAFSFLFFCSLCLFMVVFC